MEKIYFEKTHNGVHYVYGPFPTVKDAAKASFFNRSTDAFNAWRKTAYNVKDRAWTDRGVCTYGDEELSCVADDPSPYGWSKVVRKPASAVVMHRSWAEFDKDFRDSYFERVYSF